MLENLANSPYYDRLGLPQLLGISSDEATMLAAPLSQEDLETSVAGHPLFEEMLVYQLEETWDAQHVKREVEISEVYDYVLEFAAETRWRPEKMSRYDGDINVTIANVAEDVWACVEGKGGRIGEILPSTVDAILLLIVLGKLVLDRIRSEDRIKYWCRDGTRLSLSRDKGLVSERGGDDIRRRRLDPTSWCGADDVVFYLLSAALPYCTRNEETGKSGWVRLHNLMHREELPVLVNELAHNLLLGDVLLGGVGLLCHATTSLNLLSRCASAFDQNNNRYGEEKQCLKDLAPFVKPVARRRALNASHLGASVSHVRAGTPRSSTTAGSACLNTVEGIVLKAVEPGRKYGLHVNQEELAFTCVRGKFTAFTEHGKLLLKPNDIVNRGRGKLKKKKFGLTVLCVGGVYEDAGDVRQKVEQDAYAELNDIAMETADVRDWLWCAILHGRIAWKTGSCTGMWPSGAKTDEPQAISPNKPMPKEVLENLDVVSNGTDVFVLPFEGSHFFQLKGGPAGLYVAEEVMNDSTVNLANFKKYAISAVQNVG